LQFIVGEGIALDNFYFSTSGICFGYHEYSRKMNRLLKVEKIQAHL